MQQPKLMLVRTFSSRDSEGGIWACAQDYQHTKWACILNNREI